VVLFGRGFCTVIAVVIFAVVLDTLFFKWRVRRWLAQRRNMRQDAEASSGEVELAGGSGPATATDSTTENNGEEGRRPAAESARVDRGRQATAE